MEKETEKQLQYIRFIEEETGIKYLGKNKKEASDYISKNKNNVSINSSTNVWALVKGY